MRTIRARMSNALLRAWEAIVIRGYLSLLGLPD
jgi:hypothetical protein